MRFRASARFWVLVARVTTRYLICKLWRTAVKRDVADRDSRSCELLCHAIGQICDGSYGLSTIYNGNARTLEDSGVSAVTAHSSLFNAGAQRGNAAARVGNDKLQSGRLA
jgi:hypothetical protein